MSINQNQTGKIVESKIQNCPIYIPKYLTVKTLSKIKTNSKIGGMDFSHYPEFNEVLKIYCLKIIAGDKNTSNKCTNVPIDELFLWEKAKITNNKYVKEVSNTINRIKKSLYLMSRSQDMSQLLLDTIDMILSPKANNPGTRKTSMKVSNPNLTHLTFYAIPPEMINEYIADLIDFINEEFDGSIDMALYIMLQFIFIHPFREGNGLISRLIFINLMKKYDPIYTYLILVFFKNINDLNYNNSINHYRHGDTKPLKHIHAQANEWAIESVNLLGCLLDEYVQNVGIDNFNNYNFYTQLIVKQGKDDVSLNDNKNFELKSSKTGIKFYTNTALLSTLNQFDYYLTKELLIYQNDG